MIQGDSGSCMVCGGTLCDGNEGASSPVCACVGGCLVPLDPDVLVPLDPDGLGCEYKEVSQPFFTYTLATKKLTCAVTAAAC